MIKPDSFQSTSNDVHRIIYIYVYTPIYMIKHTWQSMKMKFSGELIVKKSVVSTMEHNNHQYWIQIRRCLLNISTT